MVRRSMQKQEWIVPAPSDLVDKLRLSLMLGPIVDSSGRRWIQEARVDSFKGLKIEIFSNEHPPPHFRVSHNGESANFRISDCEPITPGLNRWHRNIRAWHQDNKPQLIKAWNDSRPSDCPVGLYRE